MRAISASWLLSASSFRRKRSSCDACSPFSLSIRDSSFATFSSRRSASARSFSPSASSSCLWRLWLSTCCDFSDVLVLASFCSSWFCCKSLPSSFCAAASAQSLSSSSCRFSSSRRPLLSAASSSFAASSCTWRVRSPISPSRNPRLRRTAFSCRSRSSSCRCSSSPSAFCLVVVMSMAFMSCSLSVSRAFCFWRSEISSSFSFVTRSTRRSQARAVSARSSSQRTSNEENRPRNCSTSRSFTCRSCRRSSAIDLLASASARSLCASSEAALASCSNADSRAFFSVSAASSFRCQQLCSSPTTSARSAPAPFLFSFSRFTSASSRARSFSINAEFSVSRRSEAACSERSLFRSACASSSALLACSARAFFCS
mmetsp:Transcript_14159/g.35134  ORF Transcript_14159/g.35134 Transcript_14159/m.35134 type:complete len:372 (+) Transcript_14159:1896-3011(+)